MNVIWSLCRKYTDLSDEEIRIIEHMSETLQPLANLEGADIFIDCPGRDGNAIVVAEAKPECVPSSYKNTVVGLLAKPENEPAVARTFRLGVGTKQMKAVTQENGSTIQSVEPIRNGSHIIGVLILEKRVDEQRQVSERIHFSQQSFETIAHALAQMVPENNWLTECIDEALLMVDRSGIVTFRNSLAQDLYRRLGYIEDILGQPYENVRLVEQDGNSEECSGYSYVETTVSNLVLDIKHIQLNSAGADSHHAGLYTNSGKPLPEQPAIRAVTYSGGVADCIYQEMEGDVFRFGDIGVLLGKAIRADPDLSRVERFTSIETIRATVVGAGTHTTEVSGSTIHYEKGTLPLKNVPILKVSEEDEASLETLKASILNQMPLYMPEGKAEQLAIAFTGEKRTSFADIQALAAAIIESTKEVISSRYPLVVVVENDIGKVLGNALNVLLKREKDVICIDGIRTLSGDYIDIGEPIAGGQVLPVVIKTLIFNS